MTINDLPSDWRSVPLERVLALLPSGSRVQQGWSPQCDKVAAAPDEWGVLKTTAIQPGAFHPEHNKRLPAHFDPRPGIEVTPGDLLLTNAGPRARCAVPCLVRTTRPRLMLSGKFYRFRADETIIDPRFLEFFLLAPSAQHLLERMKTGISDSGLNLTRSKFLALPVVVPPLSAQRAIVDLLEEQLSRLGVAQATLKSTSQRLRQLRMSCLNTWRRELTADPETPMARLGEVATTSLGKMLDAKKANGQPTPYLRNINVRWGTVDVADVASVHLTEAERVKHAVEDGDLLVCEGGEPGRCAIWRGPGGMTFQKALHRVRVRDADQVSIQYLALMLEEFVRSGRADRLFTGTTIKHLPQEKLREIPIPVPGRAIQRQVVQEPDVLAATSERFLGQTSAAAARSRSLRESLLAAAFTGRLSSSTPAPVLEAVRVH